MTNRTPNANSRRDILKAGLAGAGLAAASSAQADDYITPAMTTPGRPFTAYGMPASYETNVKRMRHAARRLARHWRFPHAAGDA